MINLFNSIGLLSLFLFQSFIIWIYLQHFFVIKIPKNKFYCFILGVYFIGRTSIIVNHDTIIDFKFFSLFFTFLILFFFFIRGCNEKNISLLILDFLVFDSRRYYSYIVESCATDESDCYFCRSIFIDAINAFIYTWIKAF